MGGGWSHRDLRPAVWPASRELLYLRRHPDLFYSRLLVQVAMGFVMGTPPFSNSFNLLILVIIIYYSIFLILDIHLYLFG
jgi:hypothetical protein